MKTAWLLAAAAVLTAGLGGCADEQSEPEPAPQVSNNPPECEDGGDCRVVSAQLPSEVCRRDADGQVACLAAAFSVSTCDDAQVLGSMFRENEQSGTFEYRTAFGIDQACFEELQASAKQRYFNENDKGELVAKPRIGYREKLIVGLQISADGNVVEWERVQE